MSLLLPQYLDQLRDNLDEDEDGIPAEEMTEEVRTFFDQLFEKALQTPATSLQPCKPTDILPGKLRVAVYRERFRKKQMLFHPHDLKQSQIKARGGRKVMKRHPLNGNALEDSLVTEAESLADFRAKEAERKALRDAKAWWREIVDDILHHQNAEHFARKEGSM